MIIRSNTSHAHPVWFGFQSKVEVSLNSVTRPYRPLVNNFYITHETQEAGNGLEIALLAFDWYMDF